MQSVTISLVFLLSVVVSMSVARALPFAVPVPLVQIGLGASLALFGGSYFTLRPDVFFLLFLPPMLFLDAWRIPKEGLARDKWTILKLALGLVFFTVLGVGLFINWMIPSMPLAVAFALAAIVSPTDPIAVSAIAARVPVPARLMHILEGESLLNDASGLVCMRFAVAAALTGVFSPLEAVGTFLWLIAGGVSAGVLVTLTATGAARWLANRFGEESGTHVLLSLLIPFGAYLAAEEIQASGILAAVAAGITMSHVEQAGKALPVTRVRRGAFWDVVHLAAGGVIFVLLGAQLPSIVRGAAQVVRDTGHHDPMWMGVYVVGITGALALLRLMWVWVSLRFTLHGMARRGEVVERPSWRLVAATSLAGARGAITLAGVMTLPLTALDGTPFPARDLAIFLAAGVIIMSLASASIGLPALLTGLRLPEDPRPLRQEDQARVAAAEAALRAIEQAQYRMSQGTDEADLYAEAGARIMEVYRARIDGELKTGADAERSRRSNLVARELRLTGLRAEREEFYRLGRTRRLSDETVRKLVREIDLLETRFG